MAAVVARAPRITLDDSDRLSPVVMTGPFYPEAPRVTYTVDFEQYGIEKQIQAP